MSAVPTKYQKATSFISQAVLNSWPSAAASLDSELANIQTSIGQAVDRLSEIQADDGSLQNGIITYDAFADTLKTQLGTVASVSAVANEAKTIAQSALSTASAAQTSASAATSAAQSAIDALTGKANVNHTHSDASSLASGFMSAADKAKVDAIPTANQIHYGVTFGGTY